MSKKEGKILVVDDDQGVLYTAKMVLKPHFEMIKTEVNPNNILASLKETDFDVIILDMNFSYGTTSGKEGLTWLERILKSDPQAHVLVNTAYGDIQLAVDAMKRGAIDFLTKPWEKEKLLSTVRAIYELNKSKKEVKNLKTKARLLHDDLNQQYNQIISQSPAMERIFDAVNKVASTDANVLILGENGTGKELIAREIHRRSHRSNESFIKVDLGSIPETLFESELFGHKKGAFTDAREDRAGRLEIATGGSLFLDEIGNIAPSMQAKLLTVLQNREVMRVGSNQPIPIDIRLISATNMPIYEMVAGNQFRQDLLYRINTVEIQLPPLRERVEDIDILADHYLDIYRKKYLKEHLSFGRDTMKKLTEYHWPGNIRELQHAVERAVIMSSSLKLQPSDFLLENKHKKAPIKQNESYNIEELEKQAIENALKQCGGNLTRAAEVLGFGRSTLYRKMNKYNM
ncbi:sigma-54 dependent transcriptional regulator [Fulvivirgaceae bacterium BMA10]|uniref:Sigma-54 dependent transcriptional regulator n=1 Tax=Splendidivirga corallicola TaxID=3051826 RepID=A0ABT8KVG0_9BACT|nr:sigma-54 dependent transcriptional regulator [Fulvivirgaceae bacterium BMA10]